MSRSSIVKARLIEEHLQEFGSITSWEAIQKYRATRLSAIIFNLRKKYDIDTIMMENDKGERYGKYVFKGVKSEDE